MNLEADIKHFEKIQYLPLLSAHLPIFMYVFKDNLVDSVGLPYYEYMNFQRLT